MLVLLVRIKLEKNSYSNLESKGSLFTFSVIFISNTEPANSNAREIKCMNNYIFCDLEKGCFLHNKEGCTLIHFCNILKVFVNRMNWKSDN